MNAPCLQIRVFAALAVLASAAVAIAVRASVRVSSTSRGCDFAGDFDAGDGGAGDRDAISCFRCG